VALILGVAVVLLVGGLLVSRRDRAAEPWAGTVLGEPQEKPDFVLTDTEGRPFDLRAETEGQTTILMFGYTSCPDICPINVATLAGALDGLDRSQGQSLRMVFVTVDPARDTPEALRAYLDQFDRRFVGLTGTPEELVAAQEAAGVPVAQDDPRAEDGSYTVGHASQMILYQPDGVARIVYPFGTRQSDWSRDLPRLLAGEQPE
jgi:protein SCO1/2